jgi:hypothetical protein
MSWLSGMSKQKIVQVPPSQTATGAPGDLSWIDDVKLKRAKIERERQAQEDKVKLRRAKIERASQTLSAKRAAAGEAARTEGLNRYASDIKRVLPRGVEIVGAFFSDRPEVSYLVPAVRVDLGNGAQFDLELGRYYQYDNRTWNEGDPKARWPEGSFSGACGGAYIRPAVLTGRRLNAYEVGGPLLGAIYKTFWNRPPQKLFSKGEVENLLFEALEQHDANRKTR